MQHIRSTSPPNTASAHSSCQEKAYQNLVMPTLEYALVAWNPYSDKDTRRVKQVQWNAARFVCNDYRRDTSVTSLVRSLGWQTLEERRRISTKVTFHRIINCKLGMRQSSYISQSSHGPSKYVLPNSRIDVYLYYFWPRTIRLWNMLPYETDATATSFSS